MKKAALAMITLVAIIALAACGSATPTKTITTVASQGPPPATATTAAKPVARTDATLCLSTSADIAALGPAFKATPSDDTAAEAYVTSTLLPKVIHLNAEIGQLRDEATSASDVRRLGQVQTGLGTLVGGLTALAAGDLADGQQQASQGVGQISAASGLSILAICGGGPVGS